MCDLRVDVVLCDPSKEQQHYIGQWDMFLPSDLFLVWSVGLGMCMHVRLHVTAYVALVVTGSIRCSTMISISSKNDFLALMVFLGLHYSLFHMVHLVLASKW